MELIPATVVLGMELTLVRWSSGARRSRIVLIFMRRDFGRRFGSVKGEQVAHDGVPAGHGADMLRELWKAIVVGGSRPEVIEDRHGADHVSEDFEAVVDEVRDAQSPADGGLFVALPAEAHAVGPDTGRAEEV